MKTKSGNRKIYHTIGGNTNWSVNINGLISWYWNWIYNYFTWDFLLVCFKKKSVYFCNIIILHYSYSTLSPIVLFEFKFVGQESQMMRKKICNCNWAWKNVQPITSLKGQSKTRTEFMNKTIDNAVTYATNITIHDQMLMLF